MTGLGSLDQARGGANSRGIHSLLRTYKPRQVITRLEQWHRPRFFGLPAATGAFDCSLGFSAPLRTGTLDGCGIHRAKGSTVSDSRSRAVDELDEARLQRILGTHDGQAIFLDQTFEDVRTVA